MSLAKSGGNWKEEIKFNPSVVGGFPEDSNLRGERSREMHIPRPEAVEGWPI